MDSSTRGRGGRGGFGSRGGFRGGGRGLGGRGLGGRGRGGRGGNESSNSNVKNKEGSMVNTRKPIASPPEKYVVVITNVENDFAKVHMDRLPAFLCLDRAHMGKASLATLNGSKKSSIKDDGDARTEVKKPTAVGPQCCYDLICRSETRSAELSVYGPADAPVGSVFLTNKPANATATQQKDGADEENKVEKNEEEEALEVSEQLQAGLSQGNANGTAAFETLADAALSLRSHPYFAKPIHFHVNVPGKKVGETLEVSERCRRVAERKAVQLKAAQAKHSREADNTNRTEDDEKEEGPKAKRARAEEEKPVASSSRSPAAGDSENEVDDTAAAAAEDDVFASACEEKPMLTLMTQFPSLQKDLVTAIAVVSANQWTAREVRHQLKDLPGFLSCWRLYAKHFRVVFHDKESLFKAKQLLDQFQLEGNVRVALNLSDALTRMNADFVAQEEAGVDATTADA